MKYKLYRWQWNTWCGKIILLANISNSLKMELEIKFSSRPRKILKSNNSMAMLCWWINSEKIAKDQCYVFAPYGSLMYLLQHGQGGLAATELD